MVTREVLEMMQMTEGDRMKCQVKTTRWLCLGPTESQDVFEGVHKTPCSGRDLEMLGMGHKTLSLTGRAQRDSPALANLEVVAASEPKAPSPPNLG